ncbi:MAG TPA: hypothetical protein DEA08_11100 [Planctomycetes bacterium]|nr:hypothetical protein [Planctomycetota bacterium]
MVPDERYKKFLGIEPADEIPNYYELFDISQDESDSEVIQKAYKTQIRKLQEIRTSKDKGFIEFLKEELRKAKRILSDAEKRREYDGSLLADALTGFKDFVGSLMVMGHINKTLYDTMIARGVSDGLSETQAKNAIEELAQQHGATIESEEAAPPPAPTPPPEREEPPPPPSRGRREVVLQAPPPRRTAPSGQHQRPASDEYARPTSDEYARPSSGEYGRSAPTEYADFHETQQRAEPPPPPSRPKGPWYRGVGETPPPWGRRAGSTRSRRRAPPPPARHASSARQARPRSKRLEESIRVFNLGARLSKAAGEVHEKLRLYFPPANGKSSVTKQINGISYDKVLDTEQSTYRDSLKKFESARDKIGQLEGTEADLVRVRSTQNVALLKGYLEEIRQLKMRLLGGVIQQEELRLWQEFVNSSRSSRVTRTIDE